MMMIKNGIRHTIEATGFCLLYAFSQSDAFEDEKFLKRFEAKRKYLLSHGNALTNEHAAINGQIEKIAEHFLNGYVVKNRQVQKEDWEEFLNKIMDFPDLPEKQSTPVLAAANAANAANAVNAVDSKKENVPVSNAPGGLEGGGGAQTNPVTSAQVTFPPQAQEKRTKIPKIPTFHTPMTGTIPLISYTPEEIEKVLQFQVKNDPRPLLLFFNIILAATERHEEVNERYEENMHYVQKTLDRAWADRHSPEEAESTELLRSTIMVSMFAMYFAFLSAIRKVNFFQLGRTANTIAGKNKIGPIAAVPALFFGFLSFTQMQKLKDFVSSIDMSGSEEDDGEGAEGSHSVEKREVFRKEISLKPPSLGSFGGGKDEETADKVSPPSHDGSHPPPPTAPPSSAQDQGAGIKVNNNGTGGGVTIVVEAALDQPTPPPFRWKGASDDNPFTRQRFNINHLLRPAVDGILFYALYLPYLRTVTMGHAVSHSLTALVYLLTRQFTAEPDPYQVLHRVPPIESAVTDLFDTLLAQFFYLISFESKFIPIFFHIGASSCDFLHDYLLKRELGELPANELVDPIMTVLDMATTKDIDLLFRQIPVFLSSALKAHEQQQKQQQLQSQQQNQTPSASNNEESVGTLPGPTFPPDVLKAVPDSLKILEKFSDEMYHLFSSDHFEERNRQILSLQDALNFAVAFEDYKKRRLPSSSHPDHKKKSAKELWEPMSVMSAAVNSASSSLLEKYPDRRPISPERAEWHAARFASLPNTGLKRLIDPEKFMNTKFNLSNLIGNSNINQNSVSSPTIPMNPIIDRKSFHVIVKNFFLTLSPSDQIAELKKIDRSITAASDGNHHPVTRGDDLYQWLSYYENISTDRGSKIEKLLDLIQAYYEAILHADEIVLKEFEPELLQDYRERVMGRLIFPQMPLTILKNERENYFTRLNAQIQITRDRITGQLLLNHGLTLPQFEYLLSKFSSTSSDNEIDGLIKEWYSYFHPPSPHDHHQETGSTRSYPKVLKEKLLSGQLASHYRKQVNGEVDGWVDRTGDGREELSAMDAKVLAAYRKLLYTDEAIQSLVNVRRLGDRR